ncbi:Hypothetical predicted protein [Pelobates cultripes]|uniref:exodeoxyribonuclease III n=1 Tax=Pelobates cultripes TaxID=61616 RepID=A0AAD1W3W6_PELCU|nr:Hypothetical predicted protein [Pelobates cultripes]
MTQPRTHKQAKINFLSINARGLNQPEKRSQALRHFHSQKSHIVFIQETHFKEGQTPRLTDRYYAQCFLSNNPERKSKGTAILIHKYLHFAPTAVLRYDHGRYVCVKGAIANRTYTLANLYAPYNRQHHFIRKVVKAIEKFAEGCLILGGDLNVALRPTLDTSARSLTIPQHVLTSITKTLTDQRLAPRPGQITPCHDDIDFTTVQTYMPQLETEQIPSQWPTGD